MIITTSEYTKDAVIEARREGASPVDLIDGEAQIDLMVIHQVGVKRESLTPLVLDRDDLERVLEISG